MFLLDNRYQSQQFIFTQNNPKSRNTNPKIYQANKIAQEVLQRSKSDIDLSFSTQISEEDSGDNNSFTSANIDTSRQKMKRFFAKRTENQPLSKSRGSLTTSDCSHDLKLATNLNDSKLSLASSVKSGELKAAKKKAPAPPPPVPESLHQAVLQNMMTKKKSRAPPPPPPSSQSHVLEDPTPRNETALNIETTTMSHMTHETTNASSGSSNVSSPSDQSSSLSSPLSSMSSRASTSSRSDPQQNSQINAENMAAAIANSLIIPAPVSEAVTVQVTILSVCQASSSPMSPRSFREKGKQSSDIGDEQMSSIALKRTDSIRSISSDIDASLNLHMEQSIVSNGSHNRTGNRNQREIIL